VAGQGFVWFGLDWGLRGGGNDRKNFIRKLVRDLPVKRNSYNEFTRWFQDYKSQIDE
jgi:hypothetical protein